MHFNKEKLLSATSVDEFNLHLPNPEILMNLLIQNDNVEMFAKYYGNLSYLINVLALDMCNENGTGKLFEQQPFPKKNNYIYDTSRNRSSFPSKIK